MLLTEKASMRSRNSVKPKKLSSNSRSGSTKPPLGMVNGSTTVGGGGRSTTISGGSTPATVRTGFNRRASSNNPNKFKCLTPRSNRNRSSSTRHSSSRKNSVK